MKSPKKNTRGTKQSSSTRPAFPLAIDHGSVFAKVVEVGPEEEVEAPPAAPSTSLAEEFREVLQRFHANDAAAQNSVSPTEVANQVRKALAADLPGMIQQNLVEILPQLIREAVAEVKPKSTVTTTDPAAEARLWIAGELKSLAAGLNAVEPLGCLDNNRLLAEGLFVKAATAGKLFGVLPSQFFESLAIEIRDLVLRIAAEQATPRAQPDGTTKKGTLDTQAGNAATPHVSPPEFGVQDLNLVMTPLRAARHAEEFVRIGQILERYERRSKDSAPLFRLRVFTGRTDEEIANLTIHSLETVTEWLNGFTDLLRNQIEVSH